ncbi:MAG: rod shape-determining protein MreC [Clostridia bacterium]
MKGLFKNKPIFITIIALVLLGVIAFVSAGDRAVSFVESAVSTIFNPIQTFASSASNAIVSFFQNLFNTTDADKENEQLKIKLAQLEAELNDMEATKQENERLRDLLNYPDISKTPDKVTARVIGKSSGIWFSTFTLNVGRNQGISENMPVLNGLGLVGRVTDVSATTCKVISIIDTSSNVSVLVERTRENGFVRGVLQTGGGGNKLELYYLHINADLVPGDKILTTEYGGVFPKGILIGTVKEVMRVTDDANQVNAIITPSVDFLRLEEVTILLTGGESD